MAKSSADVAVVGARSFPRGRAGGGRVVLCDPLPPLTLTSDKSTECYRNLWPNRPMVTLTNRSIDLIEGLARESGNAFGLNRRGYLYVTAERDRLAALKAGAARSARFGSRAGRGGHGQARGAAHPTG